MAIPIIGKIIDKIIGVGGDIIKELVPDKDLAKRLDHEFRSAIEAHDAEFKQMEIQAERDQFVAHQKTVQAELHQSDLYTKRTRPKIARQSWYVTALYALSGMIIPALPESWGLQAPAIQWEIFLVLASPALTYMGVRGFEKWKNGGH